MPSAVNAASERSRKDTALTSYPDVHTYNFNVSIDELIKVLEGMGRVIRWPRLNVKVGKEKDMSMYCAYHMDHGHTTEGCLLLRKEVH